MNAGKISKVALAGLVGASLISIALASSSVSKKERILAYLKGLPRGDSKRVVSGQYFSGEGGFEEFQEIFDQSGRWPVFAGGSYWDAGRADIPGYMNLRPVNDAFIEWSGLGGLVTLHGVDPAPGWPKKPPYGGKWLNVDHVALMDKSSAVYADFIETLRIIGDGIQELKDSGVVLFFRPFHEMNGDWFWWCSRPREEFLFLWNETYDYMTKTRGLDNIIWVFSPNGRSPDNQWALGPMYYYPGDGVVDVIAFDYYSDTPEIMRVSDYEDSVATGKVVGFSELGPHGGGGYFPGMYFDNAKYINAIREKFPLMSYFVVWNGPWRMGNQLNADGLMNDPWVISRDDVPRF